MTVGAKSHSPQEQARTAAARRTRVARGGSAPGVLGRPDARAHRSGGPLRHTARVPPVRITQDPDADDLLGRDPLALLLGMLFDQDMGGGSS